MEIEVETIRRRPAVEDARVDALCRAENFRGVDRGSVEELLACSRCEIYVEGERILGPDEERSGTLLLADGQARMIRLSEGGQEITLLTLGPGDIFGLSFSTQPGSPKSPVEATGKRTVVYRMPRQRFQRFLVAHPDVAVRVIDAVSRRLGRVCDTVEDLAFHDVRTRLAHTLARLTADEGDRVVRQTHRELASLIGTRQDEVSKALRDLRDRGLIASAYRRRGIAILDVERLRSYRKDLS